MLTGHLSENTGRSKLSPHVHSWFVFEDLIIGPRSAHSRLGMGRCPKKKSSSILLKSDRWTGALTAVMQGTGSALHVRPEGAGRSCFLS